VDDTRAPVQHTWWVLGDVATSEHRCILSVVDDAVSTCTQVLDDVASTSTLCGGHCVVDDVASTSAVSVAAAAAVLWHA